MTLLLNLMNVEVVESVYYYLLNGLNSGIRHFGDNLNGSLVEDEVISIHLNEIPSNIYSLAIAVNSF